MPTPAEVIAALWRRLRFHRQRERFGDELREEMQFHLEMKASAYERGGMSPDDARWAARRAFGNATRHRDAAADVMAMGWLDAFAQDVRYAVRSLRTSRGFTAVAVVSLALGIGATTAVFTLVNAMLLASLPYANADRLVVAYQTVTPGMMSPSDTMPWSFGQYRGWRGTVPAIEVDGFAHWDELNLRGPRGAERIVLELVTPGLFPTLGLEAALGRVFTTADEDAGAAQGVALISHRLWQRVFAGDSGIIGSVIHLGEHPFTVLGVMPRGFTGVRAGSDAWISTSAVATLTPGPGGERRSRFMMGTVVARLRPGVSLEAANAQMLAAARALDARDPMPFGRERGATRGAGLTGLAEARRHPLVKPLLVLLSAAVGGVLLIVCANIAGLLLARARARQGELGVRIALGAGRGRLVRQMLAESLVLAVLGGIPGALLAYWGATALAQLRPALPASFVLLRSTDLLDGVSLAPDGRVLAFVLSLTLLVGVLFGLAPALAAARTSVADLLGAAGGRSNTGRGWGRRALVVTEVALATVLLVGAGLMVRSFSALLRADVGFDPRNVAVVNVSGGEGLPDARARWARVMDQLRSVPGVEAVATHNCTPFAADCSMMAIVGSVDGRPVARGEVPPLGLHAISEDYLRAMRIPLLAGRSFDSRDEAEGAPITILVNAAAATLLWPGADAIGHRLGGGGRDSTQWEVVGIVGDARYEAVDQPARPAVYMSAARGGVPRSIPSTLVVRTERDPARLLPVIQREIRRLEPGLAISRATTAEALVSASASSTRFITTLLGAFAVAAAFLAAIGVYGVLAYMVAQRTREFGIRMAIGAHPGSVLGLVLRQGAALTATGLALGVVGALVASDLLSRFLYGVTRVDWPTYASIALAVGVVGVVAAYVPARRATRVDPLIALRSE